MARHGEKKIDTWGFTVEGRTFGVDVYIVRPLSSHGSATTKFRAVNKELELRIEDTDIDKLRSAARGFVDTAGKTQWSRWITYEIDFDPAECEWITYEIDFDPAECERGDTTTRLKIEWSVIERCEIGTSMERHRTLMSEGRIPSYSRIESGAPHVGYVPLYHGRNAKNTFAGMIEYSDVAIRGFEEIARAMASLYENLAKVLLAKKGTDPAKFLASIASGGPELLVGVVK